MRVEELSIESRMGLQHAFLYFERTLLVVINGWRSETTSATVTRQVWKNAILFLTEERIYIKLVRSFRKYSRYLGNKNNKYLIVNNKISDRYLFLFSLNRQERKNSNIDNRCNKQIILTPSGLGKSFDWRVGFKHLYPYRKS